MSKFYQTASFELPIQTIRWRKGDTLPGLHMRILNDAGDYRDLTGLTMRAYSRRVGGAFNTVGWSEGVDIQILDPALGRVFYDPLVTDTLTVNPGRWELVLEAYLGDVKQWTAPTQQRLFIEVLDQPWSWEELLDTPEQAGTVVA